MGKFIARRLKISLAVFRHFQNVSIVGKPGLWRRIANGRQIRRCEGRLRPQAAAGRPETGPRGGIHVTEDTDPPRFATARHNAGTGDEIAAAREDAAARMPTYANSFSTPDATGAEQDGELPEAQDIDEVVAAESRLSGAGLTTTGIDDTICCFAEKTETWVDGPDGTRWEWYVKQGDHETQLENVIVSGVTRSGSSAGRYVSTSVPHGRWIAWGCHANTPRSRFQASSSHFLPPDRPM